MAEECDAMMRTHECEKPVVREEVEVKDKGIFDFSGKKEVKEEAVTAEFEEEKKKHRLGRLDSSGSSSSSDEEDDEEEEKKKNKKKDKKKKETTVPVEKCNKEEVLPVPAVPAEEDLPVPAVLAEEEEKGFLEKIKEKIPVVGKKSEEVAPPPPPPSELDAAAAEALPACDEGEAAAVGKLKKKGLLEKIKEKIPGYHPKSHEEVKEKEKGERE